MAYPALNSLGIIREPLYEGPHIWDGLIQDCRDVLTQKEWDVVIESTTRELMKAEQAIACLNTRNGLERLADLNKQTPSIMGEKTTTPATTLAEPNKPRTENRRLVILLKDPISKPNPTGHTIRVTHGSC